MEENTLSDFCSRIDKSASDYESKVDSNAEELKMRTAMQTHYNRNVKFLSVVWTVIEIMSLIFVLLLQGSILNYYLISYNDGNVFWYFWFLIDFVLLILFMVSIAFSKKFYRKEKRNDASQQKTARFGKGILNFSFPKEMGTLPLIYISWFAYSFALIAKVTIIYKQDIPKTMITNKFENGPDILELTVSSAVLTFLLLVMAHHNEDEDIKTLDYIKELTAVTVFDIFDSIYFLDLITPDSRDYDQHSNMLHTNKPGMSPFLENLIILLSAVNFLLPTIGLLPLSGTKYSVPSKPSQQNVINGVIHEPVNHNFISLQFINHGLRLILVNVPYLIIRIHLATNYDKELTVFVLKNILGIMVALRSLTMEYQQWNQTGRGLHNKRRKGPTIKVEPAMDDRQGWELPVIFDRYKNTRTDSDDQETMPSLMGGNRSTESGDTLDDVNLTENGPSKLKF